MKKRILSALLALCLLMSCLPLAAGAADASQSALSDKIARMEAALSQMEAAQPKVAAPARKSAGADGAATIALVNFIQKNGSPDEDGHPYVAYTKNINGVEATVGFTYEAGENQVSFVAVLEMDGVTLSSVFFYDLQTQNAVENMMAVILNDGQTEIGGASYDFQIDSYTGYTNLKFTQKSGPAVPDSEQAEFQESCNLTVQTSMLVWELALQELKTGVSMEDLGFAKFFALPQFEDVDPNQYYAEPVAWAVAQDITTGATATTFEPNSGCTRAQAVTFLWRVAGEPEPKSTENPFGDVKPGQYYEKAVLWAVENGITNGTSAAKFSPNETCTRGHIVTFLWRAEGKPSASAASFTDVKAGQYYADAVSWAVANGVTNGTSATKFSPDDTCTRGQIVTFLYRACA